MSERKQSSIAQAAMEGPKQMTAKAKSWVGRRQSVGGTISPTASSGTEVSLQPSKGTILNAVPPATATKMASLEEEMATGPNEEILTTVSEDSHRQQARSARSCQTSSTSPSKQRHFRKRSAAPLTTRTKPEQRHEVETRIGMWVNGVAQWDGDGCQRHLAPEEEISQSGSRPLQKGPQDSVGFAGKPNLSVAIPIAEPATKDLNVSATVQPQLTCAVTSITPGNATPAITVQDTGGVVSPVQEATSLSTLMSGQVTCSRRAENLSERDQTSTSSTASDSPVVDHDGSSSNSKRSSSTSVEAVPVLTRKSSKRLSGTVLSRKSPADLLDAASPHGEGNLNKPLPPSPIPAPTRKAPVRPTDSDGETEVYRKQRMRSMKSSSWRASKLHLRQPKLARRSLSRLDEIDREFMKSSPSASTFSASPDTMVSQKAGTLQPHALTSEGLEPVGPNEWKCVENLATGSANDKWARNGNVLSDMQSPESVPTLPKRSRKREWRESRGHPQRSRPKTLKTPSRRKSESELRQPQIAVEPKVLIETPGLMRRKSTSRTGDPPSLHEFAKLLPMSDEKVVVEPDFSTADFRMFDSPLEIAAVGPELQVGEETKSLEEKDDTAAASAEMVLLNILSALKSPQDLFSMAMINQGMYRVFKENEMQLLRTVTLNQSPPACEFREWCPPDNGRVKPGKASSHVEHTPSTYANGHRRDLRVIEKLKAHILEPCQTWIRSTTVSALSDPNHPDAQRFTDAFWRIWCFCKIFGCSKGRDEDLTGQLDWLKGGLLANNQGCVATVSTSLDFDMGSVLLNPPDHFAKGNESGLVAQQLYDMIEIWACLSALLQGYQGRVNEAWNADIFCECDVNKGDFEREHHLLEEWTCYLLTLGLDVVLQMAERAYDSGPAGFEQAKEMGWNIWRPSEFGGSRSTFLKEPVARLYEEHVAVVALDMQNPSELEEKERGRQRVAALAAEIRLRRQTSSYRRSPYIDMTMERPMSLVTRQTSMASMDSHFGAMVGSAGRCASPSSPWTPASDYSSSHPTRRGQLFQRSISPIMEGQTETFSRVSLQNFAGMAEDTSDWAVSKIVEMGFSVRQAREALRKTDMGDGLRLDRAVDLLLRQQ